MSMLLRKLKPWNAVGTTGSSAELEQASSIVADMSEQLFVKDIQIKCLTEQLGELKDELKQYETKKDGEQESRSDSESRYSQISLDISGVVIDRASIFPLEGSEEETKRLLQTYEDTNMQLLEKIKIRESENQCLVRRIFQLTERMTELEDELANVNGSKQEQAVVEEKLANKASLSSLSTAVAEPLEEPDATTFINDLFDAIDDKDQTTDTIVSEDTKQSALLTKESNSSLRSVQSASPTVETGRTSIEDPKEINTANYSTTSNSSSNNSRNSCVSLLSLNRTAIPSSVDVEKDVVDLSKIRVSLKAKSPSTRSIKSFSKRRVHQLSLYLNPSKDNLGSPCSPVAISSPISFRNSQFDDLELEHLLTPITPQSPTFDSSGFPSRSSAPSLSNSLSMSSVSSSQSKKLNFNESMSESFKRIPSVKKLKSETPVVRSCATASMEIIEEN